MNDIKTTEELMLFIINLFGESFPQSAILQAGLHWRMPSSTEKRLLINQKQVCDNFIFKIDCSFLSDRTRS